MNNVGVLLVVLCCFLTACGKSAPGVSVSHRAIGEAIIIIQDVTVFDSQSLTTREHMDVEIRDGKITAIQASGSGALPKDAYVISGNNATLVPGLIDMLGHITIATGPSWEFSLPDAEANLKAYLYSGVTTIFDPSDSSDEAYVRPEKIANGEMIGPRIFTAGRIITDPHGHPRALVQQLAPWWIKWYLVSEVGTGVETIEQAQQAVDQRIDAGADAIKIVVDSIPLDAPKLNDELTRAIVDRAKQRGIRTVAHIGTTDDAIAAAQAGVSLWVHGVYKERINDEDIKTLVDFDIPMVTTSEVFNRYGRAVDGPINATVLEQQTVAPSVLASFYPVPDDFDPGALLSWVELMHETTVTRLENVSRLHQAGMTILAGSDTQSGVFPGAGLHRELANLVDAGMTPAEAIRAATYDSARFLADGEEPDYGLIAVGKKADLILVAGDPTQDITVLQNIREVIYDGILLDRQAVEE
jgi:imidazolonepropionase-like amidohydrolase